MRRRASIALALVGLSCCVVLLMLTSVPVGAQGGVTPMPPAIGTPRPTPPPLAEALLREAQQANQDVRNQIQTVNATLTLTQIVLFILIILAVVVGLLLIFLFAEYRASLGNARDIVAQATDEAKAMRALQEQVRLRFADLEGLHKRVDDTLLAMQTEFRNSVKELQEATTARLRDLEAVRREVEVNTTEMQEEIRNQLQVVYDRGDRQMRALTDALAAQVRDITGMRQQLDAASQTLQNQIRDQLLAVTERGDKASRDLLTLIDNHLNDFSRVSKEIDAAAQSMKLDIEEEIKTANRSLSSLEATHTRLGETEQAMRERLESEFKALFERVNKLGQALAITQTSQQQKMSHALALAQHAQHLIARGDLHGATQNLTSAVEIDPENRVLHYLLADARIRQGDVVRAVEHLKRAGAGKDEYPAADALYAYALRLLGDSEKDLTERERLYTEAAAIFLKAMEHDADLLDANGESVFGALAGLYRRQGRTPEAIALYERIRKITPFNSYPVNNLALAHFAQGNRDQAKAYFEESSKLALQKLNADRGNYWAWYDLVTAEIALETEKDNLAQHLATALSLTPGFEPLEKLVFGLETLQRSPNPPENCAPIIAGVRQEIARRREAVGVG